MLEIGEKLKALRERKSFTQKDVAERLHVTPQTISKWELNKSYPDLDNLLKLSRLFAVTTDELLGNQRQTFFQWLFSFKLPEDGADMKSLNEQLMKEHLDIKEAYYVTEMEKFYSTGAALVEAKLYGNSLVNDFETLQEAYPEFAWHKVKLHELYEQVGDEDKVIIVVSAKAKAYKNAISSKYSEAYVLSQV